jgi:hypothetical protein
MSIRSLVAALAITCTGCASLQTSSSVSSHAIDPSFLPGAIVQRTSFEAPPAGPGSDGGFPGSTTRNDSAVRHADGPAQRGAAGTNAAGASNDGATPVTPITEEAAMAPGPEARVPVRADPGTPSAQRTRTALFWTGLVLTIVGGATLLGAGISGRITQGQLTRGYDQESLSHTREKTLRDRGEVSNALAAAGGGVMIVGAGLTAITFGIDYSRCGNISKRKRKDCKR